MAFPKATNGMVSGRLRRSEKQKILDALSKRGVSNPTCELCGTRAWVIGDYLVSPAGLARHPGNYLYPAPADPSHPSFLLICTNCGNTKTINSQVLNAFDLMDQESPEDG